MKAPIVISSDDPILNSLNFKPYRNMAQRKVIPFLPSEDQSQTMEVATPWGAKLTVKKGDLLVSEMDRPNDVWPVAPEIFDSTYLIIAPGICIKRAITFLVPLTEVTHGDADQHVTIRSLEGDETVRAGDFFLARGMKGEIWAYPKNKAEKIMKPAE